MTWLTYFSIFSGGFVAGFVFCLFWIGSAGDHNDRRGL